MDDELRRTLCRYNESPSWDTWIDYMNKRRRAGLDIIYSLKDPVCAACGTGVPGGPCGSRSNPFWDWRCNPDNEDFYQFVTDVKNDFRSNKHMYLAEIQALVPEVRIASIFLTGSYGKIHSSDHRSPTPESDITEPFPRIQGKIPLDIRVNYFGDMDGQQVAHRLYGKIHGFGGTFDIIPYQLDELDETPYREIQSDLFRESGVNITDREGINKLAEEMEENGWKHLNPILGIVQRVTQNDLDAWEEAAEEGYEHELAWSRDLTEDDLGLEYAAVQDGHHRAWAANRLGLLIRVDLRFI